MFSVFKISGNNTDFVYYGYFVGEDDLIKPQFLKSAHRPDRDGGAKSWLFENNGDENITVDILNGFDDEYEAWAYRNDLRSQDVDAITGPTLWPLNCHRKAENDNPEKLENWKINSRITNSKTAREAYRLGAFTKDQLKALKRDKEIAVDLDKLTPKQFCDKYDLTIMFTS